MGTKLNPGKFDCFASALPDEPTFTILARDPDFKDLVFKWARKRRFRISSGDAPETDLEKVIEAEANAEAGSKWRRENMGKWRK